jgi:hypothetical protein
MVGKQALNFAFLLAAFSLAAQAQGVPQSPPAQTPAVQAGAQSPEPVFVQVNLKLLTTGEGQPVSEVGSFGASLPLGRPGHLERSIDIENATRGRKSNISLRVAATPSRDEAGLLHCFVLSEATPTGGSVDSRAKDFAFSHPGEQIMEVYADQPTGVRVVLSVSAFIVAAPKGPAEWPPILFGLRVEQWAGANRSEIESLQLQSLDGKEVSHDYSRKVPRWVEGRQGDIVLDDLPVLDTTKGSPTVQAGQGFTINIQPEKDNGKKKHQKKDDRLPSPPKNQQAPPPPARSIVWDIEYYKLDITPLQVSKGGLRLRIHMEGRMLDPVTGKLGEVMDVTTEKEALAGEAVPIYLTRERDGGAQGYVAWIVPLWNVAK